MLGVISIFKLEEIYKRSNSSFLEREQRRLTELYNLILNHTPDDESFNQITKLASRIFHVPIALITLMTENQHWFTSCVDLTGNFLEEGPFERHAAFCHYVVADGLPLVVEDTLADGRFKDNQLLNKQNIRFYAGIPIVAKNNNVLGSICIIDTKPRSFSEEELEILIGLSYWVKSEADSKVDLIEKMIHEQSIRSLYEVISNNEILMKEKVRRLLYIGCERFPCADGMVAMVSGKNYKVLEVIGEVEQFVKIGTIIPIEETCFSNMLETIEPVHGKVTDQYIINNKLDIDEYIGAPIFVNKKLYASLFLFSSRKNVRRISCLDLEFLQLMTQMIGSEIERNQSETKLLQSQRLFQQISNNIKEAFWMYDRKERKLLYTSSACKDIYGMDSEEYNQNPTKWFDTVHPEDLERLAKSMETLQESEEYDIRVINQDKSVRWIRQRIVPITNNSKKIYRIAGVAENITEQKINEALVRRSDKLAAVGQLAASIAHEIRNPLTSIKGFIQLINNIQFPYHEVLLSEIVQIEDFIKEILMLANPHHEIKQVQSDLYDLLFNVVKEIEGQGSLSTTKFKFKQCEEILSIICDENQMKQVFLNIIDNAVEAMPNGGTITIETGKENEQFAYAIIEDQGIGMTEERLAQLGEPFYSNKEKGSGLGLMISCKIIQNHDGDVEFKSQLDKGTKVKVLMPIRFCEE